MQCCGSVVPIVPILLNPVTWMVVLSVVTGVLSRKGIKK